MKEKTPSNSSSSQTTASSASGWSSSPAGGYKQFMYKTAPAITRFLRTLFDFSFQEFITTQLIKVIYGCGVALGLLLALFSIVEAFREAFMMGIVTLIFSPILFLINVIVFRVFLELVIVIFHIGDNLEELIRNQKDNKEEQRE